MLLADSSLAALLRTLADNPDPDTVAAAIGQGALSAFQPIFTAIGFIDVDRQVLALVGASGRDPGPYSAVPLHADIPATLCYRRNEVVTTPSARLAEEFPLVASYVGSGPRLDQGEAYTFPIRHRGGVIAVLGMEFAEPVAAPWFLRTAVSTLSGPLALWTALRMHADNGADPLRRPDRALDITERQRRIIALVREGRTNAQIATEIGFSVPTVKSELARLSMLLGSSTRTDLAARAERAGY